MQRIHNTKLTHLTAMLHLIGVEARPWIEYPCARWTMGVPSVWFDGKLYELQKLAYMLSYGEIPDGGIVSRRCSDVLCFRPVHLAIHPNKMDFLRGSLLGLGDDPSLPWSTYPCIEWQFAQVHLNSYGVLRVDDEERLAHRVAYEIAYGPIQEGLNVCHHCDNPPCFRPSHLFAGTQLDNIRDSIGKGRFRNRSGDRNGSAKITEAMAIEIISLKSSGVNSADIAVKFGLGKTSVDNIASGRTWRHLTR